ncbi:MAG TPA: hypothetical protein EYM94_03705 [Gammaproteobacteria bacterium]|nr:hypothetical protein [Gammaproteobacteria bacterium]
MKINHKYDYKDYTRTTDQGRRVYLNGKEKLPSVTTILNRTKEESAGIKAWRLSKGEAEANRIMKEAAQRGSEMHEALEGYLYGQKFEAPTHEAPIALKMANLIISKGLIYLDEIWGG